MEPNGFHLTMKIWSVIRRGGTSIVGSEEAANQLLHYGGLVTGVIQFWELLGNWCYKIIRGIPHHRESVRGPVGPPTDDGFWPPRSTVVVLGEIYFLFLITYSPSEITSVKIKIL